VVLVDVSFGHKLAWVLRRSGRWLPDHEISVTDQRDLT
jgi:hypothetical protein